MKKYQINCFEEQVSGFSPSIFRQWVDVTCMNDSKNFTCNFYSPSLNVPFFEIKNNRKVTIDIYKYFWIVNNYIREEEKWYMIDSKQFGEGEVKKAFVFAYNSLIYGIGEALNYVNDEIEVESKDMQTLDIEKIR